MTNNTQGKTKKHSMRVRWKIFGCFMGITASIMIILWLCQTVFFDAFYYSVKTKELKIATKYIAENSDRDDISYAINHLAGKAQISIRVIDTKAFENLYTSGDSYGPVLSGIGIYELYSIYEEAVKNGGECKRFYENKNDSSLTAIIEAPPDRHPYFGSKGDYKPSSTPSLFFNNDMHSDLVYARVRENRNGSEIMVVGETRITPLDSTVSTLRYQLSTITLAVIILALIASFFIARMISKPIEKINSSARLLAQGKYDTRFDGQGYREIEQLNDTLNYTASELSKSDELRRDLMANVSHDMRTPLTMIIGYAEVMRDIPGENSPQNVQVVIDEAKRLSEFVNNILDLTKLQSGIENIEMSEQNLTQMARKLVSRYKMLQTDSGYTVTLEAKDDIFVRCDASKLPQVIINLIDNAVNYTGQDKTVHVRLTAKGKVARVEVSDSGKGIPEDELPYIWDRYYRSDAPHKRNVKGSGIGLSIVKAILNLHGAKFGVESSEEGSTFWFELECIADGETA